MAFRPQWKKWLEQHNRDGYFVARGALGTQDVEQVRGHIDQALAHVSAETADGPRLDSELVVRQGKGDQLDLRER